MKQKFLKTCLMVVCLLMGVGTTWGEGWTRCTAVSDLTSGGTFIIGYEATANSGKIIPMKNTGGTATTSTAGYMASGSEIDMATVTTTTDYEFTIVASTSVTGAICIKTGDNFIGNTNTKNNCKLFTEEAETTAFGVTVGTNDVFTLKIAANATYHTLQYNTGSPRFAVYGGAQKNLVFYKKTAAPTVPFTVTFSAGSNGSCSISSLTEASAGAGVTLPSVSAHAGWSFQGWSTSSTPTSANAGAAGATYKPSADITLYAYYKVIPVAPTFSTAAGPVEKGTTINFSSTTDGCTYRYTTDDTNPDAKTGTQASSCTITSDCTVKVVAVKDGVVSAVSSASYTVATHTVTFNVNGNVTNEQVANGDAISFPANPQANDVTFMGWTEAAIDGTQDNAPSDICTSATMGTEDVTYYAVFAAATVGNTYTQITALNALEAGARYLIVGNSSSTYKALPVDKAENLTTVTPSSSKITNPAEELIWTLEGTARNWKIKSVSNGKYLQISGGNLTFESSTSLTFDGSVSNSKFTFTSSATSGNKVLSYYASGSKFNAYTSANNVYLYKASVDYSDYCTTVKAVTGVAVKTAPTTVAYCEGEKFNPEGLVVTLTYEDATTKDVAYTDATASKFTFAPALDAALATTDENVQITINGQSCNQDISVRSVNISAPVVDGGSYTVKVGDSEAVTADGNTINALKGQKVVLESTPATGYKLHSTPFVVIGEDDANVSVSTAGGQYSFTMPGKNVTITAQFSRVYTIAKGVCEHGSITAIKDKDDAEITETSYLSKVVVEASAETHYHLTGMYYVKEGDEEHNEISENEGVYSFNMPQSNVTVYATFADDTQYTVSWMVNGVEAKSEQVYADVPVSAPAVEPINGKVFRGWIAAEIDGTTDETPSFVNVTGLTVSEDKVFYAVFAKEEGTPETHNIITYETENFPSSYAAAADYTLNDVSFNITQAYVTGQKTQWRASGNSNGTGTMYNNDAMDISKITLTYDNSDNYKNFTIKVGNSANPTSGTEITGVVDSNNNKVYVFDCSSENASYFVLTNGTNAGYLASIDITCGGATYSGYCTKVKTTPILSFAEATCEVEMSTNSTHYLVLINPENVEVHYSSSNEEVATVHETSGQVTTVAPGTVTITATFGGNEDYEAVSASYELTVLPRQFNLFVYDAGYATLCLPYNAKKPEGVQIFSATYNEGSKTVTLNEESAIKAGAGYVVKAEPENYYFTETAENVEEPENNHLVGVLESEELTNDHQTFIFAKKNDVVGFYICSGGFIDPNKAYLHTPNQVEGRTFIGFGDGDETAISNIESKNITDGKFLENGKIVIVKNGVKYNVNGQRMR